MPQIDPSNAELEIRNTSRRIAVRAFYLPAAIAYGLKSPRATLYFLYIRWFEGGLTEFGDSEKRPDAQSTLSSLATFTLAQGVALIGAIQLIDSRWIPLALYLLLFIATVLGIRLILSLSRGPESLEHYYDLGTIVFGRWTLGCAITLWLILSGFAIAGMFDRGRQSFTKKIEFGIPMPVEKLQEADYSLNGRRLTPEFKRTFASFIRWIRDGAAMPDATQSVLFMRKHRANLETILSKNNDTTNDAQVIKKDIAALGTLPANSMVALVATEDFDANYNTFFVDISFSGSLPIQKVMIAFSDDGLSKSTDSQPVLRLLPFKIGEGDKSTNRIIVSNPNRGERLVILAVVPSESASDVRAGVSVVP